MMKLVIVFVDHVDRYLMLDKGGYNMYGIKWKNKITGFVVRGQCVHTKDEAQKFCDKYNIRNPDINCEVINNNEDK